MRLTAEQRAAVEDGSRDILLEAGAGTGKTSTTVARYMRLLDDGIDPTAILVFTFTDKAATELRERVRSERSEASETGDFSMSSAWIGTFHAICIRILQAYPIAADVDPGFQVLDDVNAETVKVAAFNRGLAEFMTDPEHEATVGLFREGPLRATISAAYEELRSRGHITPELPPFEPANPDVALRRLAASVGETLGLKLTKGQREKLEALDELFGTTDLSGIRCAEIVPHAFDSKKAELDDHCEACREAIAELAAAEGGDRVRRHLAELLEIYGRRYTQAKRDASMLDYEDLQLITVKLLAENPAIADVFRERFGEIMVDEFQDTNRLQLQLIRLLRGPETTLFTVGDEMQAIYGFRHADVQLFRERRDTPGVKVLPLSANFRSQAPIIGAVNEVGGSLDEQARQAGDGDEGGRHQFTDLTVGLTGEEPDASGVELVLTEKKGWKPLDLGDLSPAIEPEENIGKDEDGHFEAEALCLAHRLRDLVDNRIYRQKEIVILLRTKTRIHLYRSALEQVGLSPYIVGGTGFWESREAIDVRSLLSVVANPLDDDSLLAALTSPACGLSSDALWILRRIAGPRRPLWPALRAIADGEIAGDEQREWLARMPEADVELLGGFAGAIRSVRERVPVTPLSSTVERAVTATGYDLATLARDPDGAGLANVRRVITLAHEYETGTGRDLRDFLDWIDLSADLDSESPAASVDEESDVVRLMTVHKAKGLEFDLVCLPDLKRAKRSQNDGALLLGRAPDPDAPEDFPVGLRLPNLFGSSFKLYDWHSLAAAKSAEEADEELRLFHVAMTRAKLGLILSGITTGKAPAKITDSTSMADRMIDALDIDLEDPDPIPVPPPAFADEDAAVPRPSEIEVGLNRATPGNAEHLSGRMDRPAAAVAPSPGIPPLRRPERLLHPDVPLSFTALSEYLECPARFYASRVLRLEGPGAPVGALDPADREEHGRKDATDFGLAVHALLETAGRRQWRVPGRDEIEAALKAQGIEGPRATDAVERAATMVEGYLSGDLSRRISRGSSRVEIPLLARIGGVTVRGFADLLLDDPVKPLILDYKTNRLEDAAPGEKMDEYELQRDLYALAVFRAREIEAVETAYVFLEAPDRPVLKTYLREDVEAAAARLEGLIGEFTGGHFFGGDGADHQPCGECWACRRFAARTPAALAASG